MPEISMNDAAFVRDQASGLRRMVEARPEASPVRVIAVTGGKGGVGKTNISVNLAIALSMMGRRTLLLDADLGLANVDVVLGMHPGADLSHVLRGEKTLEQVIVKGPEGVLLVPGASGIQRLAQLSPSEHAGLIHSFSELGRKLDFLIIDTAAGISDTVISFSRAAQELFVVVCDEPASITDAYAIIKVLNRDHDVSRFRVVSNMVRSPQEGQQLYSKMCKVTDRYLDVMLGYIGAVPYDENLRKAVKSQKPVVLGAPSSPSAIALKGLARKADKLPMPKGASGQLQFFVEQLIQPITAWRV